MISYLTLMAGLALVAAPSARRVKRLDQADNSRLRWQSI
jgi:hypothetical protein